MTELKWIYDVEHTVLPSLAPRIFSDPKLLSQLLDCAELESLEAKLRDFASEQQMMLSEHELRSAKAALYLRWLQRMVL